MTWDRTVTTFLADGYRVIDPSSYSPSDLIRSVLSYKVTVGLHWREFPLLTLRLKPSVLLDFFHV